MRVEAIVLGSGQDGGAPQVGTAQHQGPRRTASSVAVRTPSGRVVLFDASPDLRTQWQRLVDVGWAHRGLQDLAAVGITHGHMGHYSGLVHLGKEAADASAVPIVALPSVHEFLRANEPWATLYRDGRVVAHDATEPLDAGDAIAISAIRVPHRAEFTQTAAFSVAIGGTAWLLYLPDIDAWDQWPEAEETLAAHQVCLVDATFADADELPGRDISTIAHPFVSDTVERFRHLTRDTRLVLTHLNHSNRVADPFSDAARCAALHGFEVAFDGMRFEAPHVG